MTRKQTVDRLKAFGLKLEHRSQLCIEQFCVEMQPRQYGTTETADAFAWFECGWKRGVATETNTLSERGLNVKWREESSRRKEING